MELKELKSLAVLARTGNITRAAEQLHLTPSAIHRHLQILSEDLDLLLYEKQGRALRLTPAAESLLPLIEELFLNFDSLQAAAGDWKRLNRGTVRVGAGPTFSSYAIPGFLEAFRKAHPGLDVVLEAGHTSELLRLLAEGSIDVLFLVPSPAVEKQFVVEQSWDFSVPFVTRPGIGPTGPTTLTKLSKYPFLLYKQGSFFEEQIEHYLHRHRFSPHVAMRLDNAEPIKALVRSGFGISLLPEWAIRREVASGELKLIRLRQQPMTSRIGMIRRRTRHVSAPAAALIGMAREWDWRLNG
jgi:LysR family hydrogen peroxide-inducible transcriptional activator